MALTPGQAVDRARQLQETLARDCLRLDEVRRYWKGRQRMPVAIPSGLPPEFSVIVRASQTNFIDLVIESLAQSMAVEGFRAAKQADNAAVWNVWQANKMDARQGALHRAVIAYGLAYGVVTPGDSVPVIRGLSPRRLTAAYDGDADWPTYALEYRPGPAKEWRLYDAEMVYTLTGDPGAFQFVSAAPHRAGVTPVVRFLEVLDPDWDDEPMDQSATSAYIMNRQVIGEVAPLMTLQDQINLTTLELHIAQHYGAHRQRYIIGWLAPDEATRMKVGASTMLTFEDGPDQVKIGDLEPTPLDGYLKSRDASLRQLSAISQTPAHELIGELVNLSAEALAAAEAGRDRKIADRQTTIGESHEQMLALAGRMGGIDVPVDAQVVWRDTSARSFAATVDGLGKLAAQLKIPPDELWERIPGVSQQDVERWRAKAATGDALTNLANLLERQGSGIANEGSA